MPTDHHVLFAAVRDGHWVWGLGDPDLGAVLVTGLYFLVALACLMAGRRVRGGGNRGRSQECQAPSGPNQLLTPAPVSPPHPACGHLLPLEWGEGTLSNTLSTDIRPPSPAVMGRRENTGEVWAWWMLAAIMFCLGVNKQADLQSLLTLYGRDILRAAGLYDVRGKIQVVFIIGVMLVAALTSLSALWLARRWSWACRFAAVGLGCQAAFIVIRAASFHHVDILLGIRLGQIKINLLLESIGLIVVLMATMTAGAGEVTSDE